MKTMKLIYPLAFALAITLATTGCHNHKPGTITQLPGENPGIVGNGNDNPITMNGDKLPPETGVGTQAGAGPLADLTGFNNYKEDRAALAANTIHFAFDSAVIRTSEQANLQAVAAALAADKDTKLSIEGNCDERGTAEYNLSLGERRALAAREALAKLGIDPMRVRTISYGKDKPVDPGHDEAAWKANRHDDFVLLHPKTGA
jgi:peptidoglycan-associated lipoprotein